MSGSVMVIAEAGVNHDGELSKALALVDAAAASGADFVKFQTFKADALATANALKAAYQLEGTEASEPQRDMLRRLELTEDAHRALIERCKAREIGFLSTPFDQSSLALLAGRFRLSMLKISSGDLTNGPLLLAAARTGCKLIVSTGMGTLEEVRAALDVIAFGLTNRDAAPTVAQLRGLSQQAGARRLLAERVILLQCTTEYPAPIAEANLRAMGTMREAFGVAVGFSDHTPGLTAAIAAVALGATVVEKHLTLDRNAPGPDHRASLEPQEFGRFVAALREAELALGDGRKVPSPSEAGNIPAARKSLVALNDIAAGDILGPAQIGVMRPGDGISPMEYWSWLGCPAPRSFARGERLVR